MNVVGVLNASARSAAGPVLEGCVPAGVPALKSASEVWTQLPGALVAPKEKSAGGAACGSLDVKWIVPV